MSAQQRTLIQPLKSKPASSNKGAIIVLVSFLVLAALAAVVVYLILYQKKKEPDDGGGGESKTECTVSTDCGATTPVCWKQMCVQCGNNADCRRGETCNTSTHRCEFVPCTINSDCSNGQRCNVGSGQCEMIPVCANDGDCTNSQRCNLSSGQCESIPGCTKDTDCTNGQRCNVTSGQCEQAPTPFCTNDADCSNGQRCNLTSRQCERTPQPFCTNDSECRSGQRCNVRSGQCEQAPPQPFCTNDAECSPGQRCNTISGQCEIAPQCRKDADCTNGQRCNTSSGQCETYTPPPVSTCSQECNWPYQKLLTYSNGSTQCVDGTGCQRQGFPWLQTNTNVKLTTLQRGALNPPQFLAAINGQLKFVPDAQVTGSNTNQWYIDTVTYPGAPHIVQVQPDGTRASNPLMITYCNSDSLACLKTVSSSAAIQADSVTGFIVIRADHNLASGPQPSKIQPPEEENKLYAYAVPVATIPVRPVLPDYPDNFVPADHPLQSTWYSVGRGAAP